MPTAAATVYPETADRSLESIDALFSTDSPFNKSMERAYREHDSVLSDHPEVLPAESKDWSSDDYYEAKREQA